jgi:hypothetical protein
VSLRPPTAAESVAAILYFDRFITCDGDAIAFWPTLSGADQDLAESIVRVVVETLTPADPDRPQCPKRCDVATRPEFVAPYRWLCAACGLEFAGPRGDAPDDAEPRPWRVDAAGATAWGRTHTHAHTPR